MKLRLIAAVLTLLPAAAAAAPIDGEWVTASGSKVRIGPCAGAPQQRCGAISWIKLPKGASSKPVTDSNNPNAALRKRPLLGMQFLSGFKPAGGNRWSGGRIYDPESGKTYKSKMGLNPNGTLKVEGCVLVFCQAQTWTRAR